MSADRITKLIEDIRLLSEERYKLVQSLRKLILDMEGISEEVKYGGILFAADKPFCGFFHMPTMFRWSSAPGQRCRINTKCWRAMANCAVISNWFRFRISSANMCASTLRLR